MDIPEFETTAVTPIADRAAVVRRRSGAVFSVMALILLVISIRVAVMAAASPELGRWRLFVVPALRGRILDADGRCLAWSTLHFSVSYQRPDSQAVLWEDLRQLQDACGWKASDLAEYLKGTPDPIVVLRRNVAPDAVVAFEKQLSNHPRIKLLRQFKRHRCDGLDGRLAVWLGETRQFGWREVGISGVEKKLNRELMSGQDGKIRVLVDEDGDWIPGTQRRLKERKPGFDRYVNFRVPE